MATSRIVRLAIAVVLACAGSISALPPSSPASSEQAVTVTWTTKKHTLTDGRTYFVRAPSCRPIGSPGCRSYLRRERAVVVFLHAAAGAEDANTAAGLLAGLHSISRDTIFAFGVSKGGTRRWDAGFCCTSQRVDDVGYVTRVVNKIALRWRVDRDRIGAMGLSNGGMLALRAICDRPDFITAAVALAATYVDSCTTGRVRIGQWHGARDESVPLNGGRAVLNGAEQTLPPVVSLAQRMAPGSTYELRVLPNRGHAMAWAQFRQATHWLLTRLRP
jgi:poly(3-hydroxybutyrate) depolymerase